MKVETFHTSRVLIFIGYLKFPTSEVSKNSKSSWVAFLLSFLTLERRAGHCKNHLFHHCMNCWLKKLKKHSFKVKILYSRWASFPYKIWRMDGCIFVLHWKILCHSSTRKHPWHRLWVNDFISFLGPFSLWDMASHGDPQNCCFFRCLYLIKVEGP